MSLGLRHVYCVLLIACADPPAAAAPVPDWVEVDGAGVMQRLRAEHEPVLLVDVWSTWCEPCVEEMPMLIRVASGYRDRGLGLVLISADPRRQRDAARRLLEEQHAPLPGWIKTGSDDAFVSAMHPDWSGALPATFLFDSQRRVVSFWGEPVDEATLRPAIEAALAARR